MQFYLRFSALGDKKKWRKKLQDLTSLCTFAPMKLQKNYHTTYNVIKGTTFLMLFFLYTLSCYSNDNLSQLEVKQRKGNMLIKLHNYNDTIPLVCVIQGSGNNLEADFDPEKVLRVSGTLLNRGAATISIRSKETDEVIVRCDTIIRLENATFNLPEVTVSGMKRPIKSRISHSMGLPSFMFTENHPKLKIFKDLNMLLSNIGVKRHTDGYGQFHFFAQIMVVDGEGEIDPIPPISISPSDIKQLDFYRTKPTDPDIVVIQLKQN